MATKYASATGNWSTMTWWTTSGGSTTTTAPGVGDDADLNGKTVTVDQNVTCDNIVGTGTLSVSGNRTITANCGTASDAWSCALSTASQIVGVNGIVRGGSTTSGRFNVTGTVTLNVTGNVLAGSVTNGRGINIGNVAATVAVVGNCVGGSANNASAIVQAFSAVSTVNVTGDCTAGSGGSCFAITHGGGTLNLTGNIVDTSSSAVSNTSGTFNYTPTNAQTATIGGKTLYPTSGNSLALGEILD